MLEKPTITLLNYANKRFSGKQQINSLTGKMFGKANKVESYSPLDIDEKFKNSFADILNNPRGGGYWLWKPYIIKKQLAKMKDGEYLFYADSGTTFIQPIYKLLKCDVLKRQDIMAFQLPLLEKQWTKEVALQKMDGTLPEITETPQLCATYILFRKSQFSTKFVQCWLDACTDSNLISDSNDSRANGIHLIEHRHDQSLFSITFKKYRLEPSPDISDYSFYPESYCQIPGSIPTPSPIIGKYPFIILCNRNSHPIRYLLRFIKKVFLRRFGKKIYNRQFNKNNIPLEIWENSN